MLILPVHLDGSSSGQLLVALCKESPTAVTMVASRLMSLLPSGDEDDKGI